MSDKETFQLENFGKEMQAALRTCSIHSNWLPPSEDFYADQVYVADSNLIKMHLGIAMKFNRTKYMAVRAPSYCEHLKMNSGAWNLFTALAQMGGFIPVAVFVLRAVIWPMICYAGGWSSSLTTESRRLWVDQVLPSPSCSRMKRLQSASF
ncbi:hypothetical protein SUGI_0773080 [Cryptomeria japonica]|nr:hypothetical protein SUGI_0773080 [Cryptomeria japonica]